MGATEAASSTDRAISFGSFRLSPRQRLLLEAGKPVRVGSRALDLLIALAERPGELLSKAELISRAWPTTHVVEENLRFQISALRRALRDGREGHRFLEASPGRGYRFVANVIVETDAAQPQAVAAPVTNKNNLQLRLTPLIGRADLVSKLARQVPAQRLTTLVGPGGIGKTSVAIATAEQLISAYKDGVWSIDLGFANPAGVQSAVAAAIGIKNPEAPMETLAAALRDARILLVLDNCAHVIDAVARLVNAVLKTAPGANILATSREPLRVEGEHIYRLGPLESPPASEHLTSAEALRFPAVELFLDVATASDDRFKLHDRDAPVVGEICRTLDGIPLAIELAASRVDVLGVRGLAARLADRLQVLAGGRRSAPPRHKTMRATVDWSYDLLSPSERIVFSRLAIFAGGFTLAAAAAVAGDPDRSREEIANLVMELATKSLVAAESDDPEMWLRLLDTTRAYALEKLAASSERESVARRHAEHYQRLFEQAEAEWQTRPAPELLTQYQREIDNLRIALDWAFSPRGDASTGIALTAAAAPLWMHLSLLEECRSRADQALGAIAAGAQADAMREMKLLAERGATLMYTRSVTDPEVHDAWSKVLELAQGLGDIDYELRALLGIWSTQMRSGQYRTALELARRFRSVASKGSDPNDGLIGERLIGDSEYLGGNLRRAQHHLEHMLAHYTTANRWPYIRRFHIDHLSAGRAFLARIFWLQGLSDQATRTAETSIQEARETAHLTSICYALALAACPIALWTGDLAVAERHIATLLDESRQHGLTLWEGWGRYYRGVLLIKRGDFKTGSGLIQSSFNVLGGARFAVRFIPFHGEAVLALGAAGETVVALAEVDKAISRFGEDEDNWLISDLLRTKAELLLYEARAEDARAAEEIFRDALATARRAGALALELRSATSLARVSRRHDRGGEALMLLRQVYDRFTEGLETADVQSAKALVDSLA